jgi:thymidylate synthase (FAD)
LNIDVLDKGYVRLINTLGTDVDVVNSARVSFDKSVSSLSRLDFNLIDYLIKNKHDSVLRHCAMTFEVYAPLFVARQWWKHHVSATSVDDQNGWNESSRRYVTEEPEFYIPGSWRATAENKKQGSSGEVDPLISAKYNKLLGYFAETGIHAYDAAMKDGVAVEQARLFLPAYAMYVRWRWTASLNALLHFVSLRLDEHAQWEMQQYATAIAAAVKEKFPSTYASWEKYRVG